MIDTSRWLGAWRGLALVVVPALAGCLGPAVGTLAPASSSLPAELADLPFLELDHDHADPSLHVGSHNLSLSTFLQLPDATTGPLRTGELDAFGDLAVLAIVGPPGGFALYDISDIDHPRRTALVLDIPIGVWDAKLGPGNLLFLGAATGLGGDLVAEGHRGAADPIRFLEDFAMDGVYVYDVSDPQHPSFVSHYFIPVNGVHMLDVHVIDGTLYVFSAIPNYSWTQRFPSGVDIARYDAAERRLVHLTEYLAPEQFTTLDGPLEMAHDVTVYDDPIEGPLLVMAGAGINVASVKDPANPVHRGTWYERPLYPYHTVMMEWVEGRRVVFQSPEGYNELWFFDATDLSNIQRVSTWKISQHIGRDQPGQFRFSTHNINLADGKLFLAHYHAGVWVLDVSTWDRIVSPRLLGFYEPHEAIDPSLLSAGVTNLPSVWDVVPTHGRVLAPEQATGLYVLRPDFFVPDEPRYGDRSDALG